MFLCSNIKIVFNEVVTAKKVDNVALEKFNMKPGAGAGLTFWPAKINFDHTGGINWF